MSSIFFYVYPHEKPHGTHELVYTKSQPLKHESQTPLAQALLALDTAYDLTRHRYATRLSKGDANAAFCVRANVSASFQHSVIGPKGYSEVVDELNTQWLRNRMRLAKALAS